MKRNIITAKQLERLCEEAEAGDAQAAYEAAEYYYGRREFEKAYAWYLKAAQCDDPNPMVYFNIGYACQNGEGTEVDLVSAYDFYEKAAARGLPQALYNLAYFYQNGLVVKRDCARAAEYSRRAAKELEKLVNRLHDAENREEKLLREHLEIMQSFEDTGAQWRAVAEENARVREQLAEARTKKNIWKSRAAEYEKKIRRLEAENRNMEELLLKAQYELERYRKKT